MSKKQRIYIILFGIATVLAAVIFSSALKRLAGIVTASAVCAYLLLPLAKALEKRCSKRGIAVIVALSIVITLLFCAVSLFVPVVIKQIKELLIYLPAYVERITAFFAAFTARIPMLKAAVERLDPGSLLDGAQRVIASFSPQKLVTLISTLLLVPVLTFYILRDRHKLQRVALFALPGKARARAVYIARDIDRQMRDYVFGEMTVIFTVSALMALALFLFGFRYWLILGIIMGIFNIIPYIGPVLGSIPIILTAISDNSDKALLAFILIIAVQQIDNLLIQPRVIGSNLSIHPAVVLLCVVAGNAVSSIGGMVLAIPVYIVLRILFKEFYKIFSERKQKFPQINKI